MHFSESMIKQLSFPDFEITVMDWSFERRKLVLQLEGAWWNADGGMLLGRGSLVFYEWEGIAVRKYDMISRNWMDVGEGLVEPLKDLPDMTFSDATVYLFGFAKKSGQWMEWKIVRPKMYADFEI